MRAGTVTRWSACWSDALGYPQREEGFPFPDSFYGLAAIRRWGEDSRSFAFHEMGFNGAL